MEWSTQLRSWEREADKEEPVENRPKSTTNSPNHPSLTELCAAFTSLVAVAVTFKDARQTRDLFARKERGRFARRARILRRQKACRLRMTDQEHVSRQSPNSRRRKGTVKGPGGIQAGDRREVWTAILHHESGWEGCSSVSLRGMGADRAEAGRALHFQSYEEEVPGPSELLRAAGGDGWARSAADAAIVARCSQDQGRSGGSGQSDL